MDRKAYMRDVYSRYWADAREKKYGFMVYDQHLCDRLSANLTPAAKLLEVAIGTGYPFGAYFSTLGMSVHGVDISPTLIEQCQRLYPSITSKVGDAEALDFPDGFFDATYCFHASWYFPNLNGAIDEMLRVTRVGGVVMFDIQNRSNLSIEQGYRRRIRESKGVFRVGRYLRNTAKIALRKGVPDWHFIVYEVPTYPEDIYRHLAARAVESFDVLVRENSGTIAESELRDSRPEYPRLVFVIRKGP